MAPIAGDVAGLVVEAVDRERPPVDQGVGQHQAAGGVPVAAVPEVGVARQEDDEDPGLGPAEEAQGVDSGRGLPTEGPPDQVEALDGRERPQERRAGLDREEIAIPGQRDEGRDHHQGHHAWAAIAQAAGGSPARSCVRPRAIAATSPSADPGEPERSAPRSCSQSKRTVESVRPLGPERPEPAESLDGHGLDLLERA